MSPPCAAIELRHAPERFNATALPVITRTSFALFVVLTALLGVSLGAAVLTRDLAPQARARPLMLTALAHVGPQLFLVTGCWGHVISGMAPCPVGLVVPMLIVPLATIPYGMRLSLFARRYLINLRAGMISHVGFGADNAAVVLAGEDTEPGLSLKGWCLVLAKTLACQRFSDGDDVRVLQFMTSNAGLAIQFVLTLLPFLILTLVTLFDDPDYLTPCLGCAYTTRTKLFLLLGAGMALFMLVTTWIANRKNFKAYRDPFYVLLEIKIAMGWGFLAIVAYALHVFVHPEFPAPGQFKDGFSFVSLVAVFVTLVPVTSGLGVSVVAQLDEMEDPAAGNNHQSASTTSRQPWWKAVEDWFHERPLSNRGNFPGETQQQRQYHTQNNNSSGNVLVPTMPSSSQGGGGSGRDYREGGEESTPARKSSGWLPYVSRKPSADRSNNSSPDHTPPHSPAQHQQSRRKQLIISNNQGWRARVAAGARVDWAALLHQIASTPTSPAHAAFEEYLMGELSVEGLKFMDCALQWRLDYFDALSPSAINVRAKKIVRLFVGHMAEFPLNLSDTMANQLKQTVLAAPADTPVARTVFDDARAEVAHMLQHGPLPRFARTPEFAKLAEEGLLDVAKCLCE